MNAESVLLKDNVIAALSAVIDEMPPISKGGTASPQQGGYAYRGIEQITAVAAPLLAKHGVVFVPQVMAMETRDLTVNSKPWTDTILTVRYRICGPGGPDDFVEATVVGMGRDNSDKGANKALTQAFKYALTQTLCIGDSRDDVDGQTHEADEQGAPAPEHITDEQATELHERLYAVGKKLGAYPDEWVAHDFPSVSTLEAKGGTAMLAENHALAVSILDAAEQEIAGAGEPVSETASATAVTGVGDDGDAASPQRSEPEDSTTSGGAPLAASPAPASRKKSAREYVEAETLDALSDA